MKSIALEFEMHALRQRIWQILPGALSWGTLIGLTILALVVPYWIAIYVIAYDVYILVRIVYMSVHLIYAYRMLTFFQGVNWVDRCIGVSMGLEQYLKQLRKKLVEYKKDPLAEKEYAQTKYHIKEVEKLLQINTPVVPWDVVHHLIIIPTYDESLIVLKASIQSLVDANFPHERLHVAIGFEERATGAKERAEKLTELFKDKFATFITTFHPDGLPGEKRVKSANASWAVQELEKATAHLNIPVENVLVSNFDSDTVASTEYFSHLTYTFITTKDRHQASYQPLPVYNNNVWDVPAFSRVIATGSTFWQMIESTRPERLVTFSSHSMTLKALKDVNYWARDIISEDSRIFWQCLLHYNGNYRTEPLYVTVSMDAALAPTWWQTLINQYKQKRRWAWGIENFPYMAEGFLRNTKMKLSTKFTYLFRTVEGHYSWATSAIVVAGLGWLPVFFGDSQFHSTVLSYSLPRLTRTLMSIAMSGLIISATLSLLLLPKRPKHYSKLQYVFIILQWVLVPVIATLLSAFPALDAETRLMFGRDINFNVMQKGRRHRGKVVA